MCLGVDSFVGLDDCCGVESRKHRNTMSTKTISRSTHFTAALVLIPATDSAVEELREFKDKILTGFGAVRTQDKLSTRGVQGGSESARKAAQWAKCSPRTVAIFAASWALATELLREETEA